MLASIDWVTIHDKVGFFIVVAAVVGAIVALISLVTPFVDIVLKLYLRLLLLAVAIQIVLGAGLYFGGHRPEDELHYLYGAGRRGDARRHLGGEQAHPVAGVEAPARRRGDHRDGIRDACAHLRLTGGSAGVAASPGRGSRSRSACTTTTLKRERMRIRPARTGAPEHDDRDGVAGRPDAVVHE